MMNISKLFWVSTMEPKLKDNENVDPVQLVLFLTTLNIFCISGSQTSVVGSLLKMKATVSVSRDSLESSSDGMG